MSRADALGLAAVSYALDPEAIARALAMPAAEVAQVLFPEVVTESIDGAPRWVLSVASRRRVLAWERVDGAVRATGAEAVARWLTLASPAVGVTETLLRAWLAGRLTDVPQRVRAHPEELRRVANWLADCAWVTPTPREVLARLALDDLRRRCEAAASATFVGRKDVLGWMRDQVAREPRVIVVEGGGGLGKSALLATFALRAGAFTPGGPVALWLDLDDPSRSLARPDLLHAELARQAAIQVPALDGVARELRAHAEQTSRDLRTGVAAAEAVSTRDGRGDSLADYLFASLDGLGRPVFLIVDTLERGCHSGLALLDERLGFWRQQLAARRALHLIAAGRGPLPLATLADAPRTTLKPLPRDRSAKLLAELDMPDAYIHRVLDRLGPAATTPLNLRLCARAVAELGIDELDDERLERALRAARVAGYLQRRIIDHLPSPRLAELVRLAIHLPVITVEDLVAIVGPLVTPPLTDGDEAAALFAELVQVVDLVGRVDGGAAVTLRPEVADELRDLALDEEPARVVALLERAVAVIGLARPADRQFVEAALAVARRRSGVVTAVGVATGSSSAVATSAVTLDRAVGALRELLAAGRASDAVDQAGLLVEELVDAALLIELAQAALGMGAWLRAEAFARRAADKAGEPVRRALALVLQARAVTGLPTGERPDGVAEATALRAQARSVIATSPPEAGAAVERAEVLTELARDDRRWARDELRALGASRRWTALTGASLPLVRAIGALAANRDAIDWAAQFGGFDGPAASTPNLARVAELVAARAELVEELDLIAEVLLADRPITPESIATALGRVRGDLGLLVRHWVATLTDDDPLIAALADMLGWLRGEVFLHTESGTITINLPPVTATAADKARLLAELADSLTAHHTVESWRELLRELGDRRVLARATSDDLGLAVRSALAELDRLGAGERLVAALERRGLHAPA